MAAVRETKLPGVGVRHDFTADDGTQIGVLVRRDGQREILVYDRDDPDACSSRLALSPDDTRTLGDGAFRTRTGCSVVAVLRGDETVPAPGPDFEFRAHDVAVVVGTLDGLQLVRSVIHPAA